MTTHQHGRPRFHRKHDRLVTPGASAQEIAADFAAAPFDRAWRDMDRKWGIDRLPGLVPPDMAAKLGRAVGALNAAIDAGDPDAVAQNAANCARGLAACDAWAEANGKPKASGEIWEYDLDGVTYAIVRDEAEWQSARRKDTFTFTLREALVALRAMAQKVPHFDEIKAAFPKARVTDIRPHCDFDNGGDPIPGEE